MSPNALRRVYFDAWQKASQKQPLSEMELVIVDVIQRHPEYHILFSTQANFEAFTTTTLDHNPFFHLSLHVAIIEQVTADRPQGIKQIYNQLLKKYGDKNQVEHQMMKVLAQFLAKNFASQEANNDAIYLTKLKQLL